MSFLLLCAFCLLFVFSVTFHTLVLHPFSTVYYGITDLYKWFRYKRWHELKTGELICYCALFGKGKTLSVVHYITSLYDKYNDKLIYDFDRKKWVTQKVHIISNVDLKGYPYEQFVSLSQVVAVTKYARKKDFKNDTLTCTLVLGDEFGAEMNCRSFKTNITPTFLNTLLTCRHNHISFVYDSQRFHLSDALLRQVTYRVIQCNKVWRVMVSAKYDAWELENASSPAMIKPLCRYGWFIKDKDYNAYDTLACVDHLVKKCEEGDMLSEEEILALQCSTPANMDIVERPSRKFWRNMKKRK